MTHSKGKVYLIGAGPGDPGLITVKGLDCVRKADVIIYDYLANERLLEQRRHDAELIYVGKQGGRHTLPQEEINALIVQKALAGSVVARLKGGDPFIFGRGGEEAEACVDKGIPFEVVPGVTAATAGPTYAGIPLTHREHAQSCLFVTGNLQDGSLDLDTIIMSLYLIGYNVDGRYVTPEPLGPGGDPYPAMHGKPDPATLDRLVLQTASYFREREEVLLA